MSASPSALDVFCGGRSVRSLSVVACLAIGVLLPPAVPLSADSPGDRQAPIDSSLLEALAHGQAATFLVRLDRPDVAVAAGPTDYRSPDRAAAIDLRIRQGELLISRLEPVVRALTAGGHVSGIERFPGLGMLAVTGDDSAVIALASSPVVAEVRAEGEWRLVEPGSARVSAPSRWNLEATKAPRAWALGVTGQGAVVATIDTGADWTHPALRSSYRGRDGNHDHDWIDVTQSGLAGTPLGPPSLAPTASRPIDPHGHGTHVVGLLSGANGPDIYGVAPGAQWIAARAFDSGGTSRDLWLLRAAEWVLAPTELGGGEPRPDLAPDVVNCSWVLDNPADPLLADIVESWLAASIVPVFAAGNDDDGTGSWAAVRAPGSYAGTLAVGASTPRGDVWALSRAGPGHYGGVKPDLIAPGVDIVSTAPGGAVSRYDGTSMAAAHVSGAAALVISAAPHLEAADVMSFLRFSAVDGGAAGPDDVYGYGHLDALAAVARAITAGRVAGDVSGDGGDPAAGIRIEASRPGGPSSWATTTGADGRYDLALPQGRWAIAARAFGHESEGFDAEIRDDRTLELDLRLRRTPTTLLEGVVRSSATQQPLAARVGVVGEGPASSTTADGAYELRLPKGVHELSVEAPEHRTVSTTLTVTGTGEVALDFELPYSGRILVVDADAWDEERAHPYIADGLSLAGYSHDLWVIDDLRHLPEPADLAQYDILVWNHLFGSPGTLDFRRGDTAATDRIRAFVEAGGSLLITGQDIGQLDSENGSWTLQRAPAFYREVLSARFVSATTSRRLAAGAGPLAGSQVALDWAAAHPKGRRLAPDVVEPLPDGARTSAVAAVEYSPSLVGGVAAQGAGGRRLYLSFGPESSGPGPSLARLLDLAMAWLETPTLLVTTAGETLAPGAAAPVTATLHASRTSSQAVLTFAAADPLRLVRGSPGLVDDGSGGWSWSGPLSAGAALAFVVEAELAGPAHGTDRLPVAANLTSAGRRVTETVALRPVTPDIRPSSVRAEPDRLPSGGHVRMVLELSNAGSPAASAEAVVTLPDELAAISDTLMATGGEVAWGPGAHQLTWRGPLDAGRNVTVTVEGRLPAGTGIEHVWVAELSDGAGSRVTRRASAVVGGPDLSFSELLPGSSSVTAGQAVTPTLVIRNAGRAASSATAASMLPENLEPAAGLEWEYNAGEHSIRWSGVVDASDTAEIAVPLVAGVHARGRYELAVELVDGYPGGDPVTVRAALDVNRADLSASQAALLPRTARSGDIVTGTVLIGNHGDVSAEVAVTDALPAVLVIEPGSVAVSAGAVSQSPGNIGWTVPVAPPAGEYGWEPTGSGSGSGSGSASASAPGHHGLPGPAGEGLPQAVDEATPVDLGLHFPFFTDAYTRVWATSDGLLVFGDSEPEVLPAGGRVAEPSIAALWRPGRGLGQPTVFPSGKRVAVTWPGEVPGGAVCVVLEQGGNIGLEFGPAVSPDEAIVGLHNGRVWAPLIPPTAVTPGGGVNIVSPGGWHWLTYRARLGAALPPNSMVSRTVTLESGGVIHTLRSRLLANRLGLSGTQLQLSPSTPVAGGLVAGELILVADGDVTARGVAATIRLPDASELVPDSLSGGLRPGSVDGEIVWLGALVPGEPQRLAWTARLGRELPLGLHLLTQATVAAAGLEPLHIAGRQLVGASDLSGSSKKARRPVAFPGDTVPFMLVAANAGTSDTGVVVTDALPPGLEYVPGTLRSSAEPDPEWDGASRSMRWAGTIPARGAVQIELAATYLGPGRVSNVMHIDDRRGTTFAAWADVALAVDRVYLPELGRD